MIPTAPIPTQPELDAARLVALRCDAAVGVCDSGSQSLADWLRDNERRQLRARARRIRRAVAAAALERSR